jgi:hypothetical protein
MTTTYDDAPGYRVTFPIARTRARACTACTCTKVKNESSGEITRLTRNPAPSVRKTRTTERFP